MYFVCLPQIIYVYAVKQLSSVTIAQHYFPLQVFKIGEKKQPFLKASIAYCEATQR